jgi:uncharacterized membrane protein YdjX (TVP38/TMEM64 family)
LKLPPRLLLLAALAVLLLSLTLLWQFGPGRDWLQPEALLAAARAQPLALLLLLAVLALGPLQGALLALLGGMLGGLLTVVAGRLLGRDAVARIAGPKLQAVNALVARRGALAVFLVRLVPVAPFALVNLVLGVTPVRLPAFVLGNSAGMLPMVLVTAWLAPELLAQLQQPSRHGLLALGAVLALVLAASWALKRWVGRL